MSDMLGYSAGGIFMRWIGVKKTMLLGWLIATCGGFLILFYGLHHEGSWSFLF